MRDANQSKQAVELVEDFTRNKWTMACIYMFFVRPTEQYVLTVKRVEHSHMAKVNAYALRIHPMSYIIN